MNPHQFQGPKKGRSSFFADLKKSEEEISQSRGHCIGLFDPWTEKVIIQRQKGNVMKGMGSWEHRSGKLQLFLEEALFLTEKGHLQVFDDSEEKERHRQAQSNQQSSSRRPRRTKSWAAAPFFCAKGPLAGVAFAGLSALHSALARAAGRPPAAAAAAAAAARPAAVGARSAAAPSSPSGPGGAGPPLGPRELGTRLGGGGGGWALAPSWVRYRAYVHLREGGGGGGGNGRVVRRASLRRRRRQQEQEQERRRRRREEQGGERRGGEESPFRATEDIDDEFLWDNFVFDVYEPNTKWSLKDQSIMPSFQARSIRLSGRLPSDTCIIASWLKCSEDQKTISQTKFILRTDKKTLPALSELSPSNQSAEGGCKPVPGTVEEPFVLLAAVHHSGDVYGFCFSKFDEHNTGEDFYSSDHLGLPMSFFGEDSGLSPNETLTTEAKGVPRRVKHTHEQQEWQNHHRMAKSRQWWTHRNELPV